MKKLILIILAIIVISLSAKAQTVVAPDQLTYRSKVSSEFRLDAIHRDMQNNRNVHRTKMMRQKYGGTGGLAKVMVSAFYNPDKYRIMYENNWSAKRYRAWKRKQRALYKASKKK